MEKLLKDNRSRYFLLGQVLGAANTLEHIKACDENAKDIQTALWALKVYASDALSAWKAEKQS